MKGKITQNCGKQQKSEHVHQISCPWNKKFSGPVHFFVVFHGLAYDDVKKIFKIIQRWRILHLLEIVLDHIVVTKCPKFVNIDFFHSWLIKLVLNIINSWPVLQYIKDFKQSKFLDSVLIEEAQVLILTPDIPWSLDFCQIFNIFAFNFFYKKLFKL